MKKLALLFMTALLCLGGYSASAQGKYGADSAECIKYLSYYKEYFKQRNYDEALPHWRKAFKLCPPTANQTMLIDGTTLLRRLITENSKNTIYRDELIDSLMMIHDIRAQYYGSYAVKTRNNKGLDLINYMKDDPAKLYEELKKIIEQNAVETMPQLMLFELNTACNLYNNGILVADDVINEYNNCMELLDKIQAKDPSDENLKKIRTDMESLFIASKVASCDNLIALFTPRYEANPNDKDLVSNIVRMMSSTEGCTDNDLFLNAANSLHSIEPTYSSAYFLYRLYSSRGDLENSVKFMEEAIAYPDSDSLQDAQYYYELATFCFKNGMNSKAFESALKALELDPSLSGKSYMLIGTIWGSQVCQGNEIERRAPYWVAVDYLIKAKNADETLTDEANNLIRQYSTYYPQTAEAFMYNVTDGDSYTVSCGGMRAVTTVRTQN